MDERETDTPNDSGICKWVSADSNGKLIFTSTEPIRLSGFAMKSANDCYGRDPCQWKFYAINEAGEEIKLHETPDNHE